MSKKLFVVSIIILAVFGITLFVDLSYYFYDDKIVDISFRGLYIDVPLDIFFLCFGIWLLIDNRKISQQSFSNVKRES